MDRGRSQNPKLSKPEKVKKRRRDVSSVPTTDVDQPPKKLKKKRRDVSLLPTTAADEPRRLRSQRSRSKTPMRKKKVSQASF